MSRSMRWRSAGSPFSASSSTAMRMRARGERSSWEAAASVSRWASTRAWMRSAAWLKLRASAAISSLPSTSTRAARSPAPRASTRACSRSSRRARRRARGQAPTATANARMPSAARKPIAGAWNTSSRLGRTLTRRPSGSGNTKALPSPLREPEGRSWGARKGRPRLPSNSPSGPKTLMRASKSRPRRREGGVGLGPRRTRRRQQLDQERTPRSGESPRPGSHRVSATSRRRRARRRGTMMPSSVR